MTLDQTSLRASPSRSAAGGGTPPEPTPAAPGPAAVLAELLAGAQGHPERLGPDGVLRLAGAYRGALAELGLARRRWPGDPRTAALERLVRDAHGTLYATPARRSSLADFARRRYWRATASSAPQLALAAAFLLVPAVACFVWALVDPAGAGAFVPGAFLGVTQARPHGANLELSASVRAAFAATIFTHNIEVAFLAFAGGITAGLLTVAALAYNGAAIGVVAGLATGAGEAGIAAQLLVPHGLLELSCIVVCGAAGLRLARALVRPGFETRGAVLAREAPVALEMVLGTACWLVVAGLVEGFLTPAGLGLPIDLAVGFTLALGYWSLVVFRGRSPRAPQAAARAFKRM